MASAGRERKRDKIKRYFKGSEAVIASGSALPSTGSTSVNQGPQRILDQEQQSSSLWKSALKELPLEDQTNFAQANVTELDIVDNLIRVVRGKQEESEHKQWKFTLFGTQIILRDIMGKLVGHLKKFRDIGDTVASYDPVHFALPWAGVKFVLQSVINDDEQLAMLLIGFERVTNLICRCYVYENLYLHKGPYEAAMAPHANSNLRAALLRLYVGLLNFIARGIRIASKSTAGRLITAWFDAEALQTQLNNLDSLERTVFYEAENSGVVLVTEGQRRLQQLLEDFRETLWRVDSTTLAMARDRSGQKRKEILKWISDSPYKDHHYDAAKGRLEGTGDWLFAHDQYLKWQQSEASCTLWLYGSPGVGKTKLISKLIDEYYKRGQNTAKEPLVYFYCVRGEPSRGNPTAILQSFVRQLSVAVGGDSLPAFVADLYESKQRDGFASSTLTIEESTSLLHQLSSMVRNLTIILDALDECDPDSRLQLVDILSEGIMKSSGRLKLFISSRPDRDIKVRLKSESKLEIDVSKNYDDIAIYVRQQIRDKKPASWQSQVKIDLEEQICRTLIDQCQGMFQWAVLQLGQLFRLSLQRDILLRLGKLPAGLGQAYDEIYAMVENQSGSGLTIANRAFQWLMCSQEPPSSRLLTSAVCQDPQSRTITSVDIDVDFILEACQNLIVYNEKLDEFRFAHQSVREYLQPRLMTVAHSHAVAGKVCLGVLTDPVFQATERQLNADVDVRLWYNPNRLGKENAAAYATGRENLNLQDPDFLAWVRCTKARGGSLYLYQMWPLLRYARQRWARHLRAAGAIEMSEVKGLYDILWEFLGDFEFTALPFESWYSAFKDARDHLAWDFPGVGWCPVARLRDKTHQAPFKRYRGKAAFAVCLTGLDEVTRETWSQWPLSDDLPDTDGDTLLHATVATGSVAMAEHVMRLKPRVAAKDMNKFFDAAVEKAVRGGAAKTLEVLLKNGADPNRYNMWIHYALTLTHMDIVETFFRSGTNVNGAQKGKSPFLLSAIETNSPRIVRYFMELGADVNLGGRDRHALHEVARDGTVELAEILMDYGGDVNIMDTRRHTALQYAAASLKHDMLSFLLSHKADVNICGEELGTALQAAVSGKDENIAILKMLIDHGAEVNILGGKYGSALQAAAASGKLKATRLLLDHGGDVNAFGGKYNSALQAAAASCSIEIVQILLDDGADVNALGGQHGSALKAAAASHSLEIVQILLDRGADVNVFGGEDGYALHAAAYHAGFDVVKILLDHGANVDATGSPHGSALLAASSAFDRDDTIELLLDHGADAKAKNPIGHVLHAAAFHNGIKAVSLLLNCGVDVHATGGRHVYALQAAIASETDRAEKVQALVDNGADINAHGGPQEYPFLAAARQYNSHAVVKVLLDAGADVRTWGGEYGYALQAAVDAVEIETVELLLDRGADVRACGKEGYPIHFGVGSGDLEMVQFLLERGAEVNVRTKAFGTCLHEAKMDKRERPLKFRYTQPRMIKLLKKYGAVDEPPFLAEDESAGASLEAEEELRKGGKSSTAAEVDQNELR